MIDRPLLSKRLNEAYEYLRNKGLVHTITEFANMAGKTQGDISNALACRGRVMTKGLLERVADTFPDILNREYLLEGKGKIGLPERSMKPHFPATVRAGVLNGDLAQVMDYDVEMEPAIKRFGNYDYMIDVDGDSMEPTYWNGDSVACRRIYDKNELETGKTYVFVTTEGAVLKRYVSSTLSSVRVRSDNPKYKPYSIDMDSILCIAEVVGSISSSNHADKRWNDQLLKLVYGIIDSNIDKAMSDEEILKYAKQILGRDEK